jgi:hypothetical protein
MGGAQATASVTSGALQRWREARASYGRSISPRARPAAAPTPSAIRRSSPRPRASAPSCEFLFAAPARHGFVEPPLNRDTHAARLPACMAMVIRIGEIQLQVANDSIPHGLDPWSRNALGRTSCVQACFSSSRYSQRCCRRGVRRRSTRWEQCGWTDHHGVLALTNSSRSVLEAVRTNQSAATRGRRSATSVRRDNHPTTCIPASEGPSRIRLPHRVPPPYTARRAAHDTALAVAGGAARRAAPTLEVYIAPFVSMAPTRMCASCARLPSQRRHIMRVSARAFRPLTSPMDSPCACPARSRWLRSERRHASVDPSE